jgi:hypothetical protein
MTEICPTKLSPSKIALLWIEQDKDVMMTTGSAEANVGWGREACIIYYSYT